MGCHLGPRGLRWLTHASVGEPDDGWVVSQDVEEAGKVSVGTQQTRPGISPYWRHRILGTDSMRGSPRMGTLAKSAPRC